MTDDWFARGRVSECGADGLDLTRSVDDDCSIGYPVAASRVLSSRCRLYQMGCESSDMDSLKYSQDAKYLEMDDFPLEFSAVVIPSAAWQQTATDSYGTFGKVVERETHGHRFATLGDFPLYNPVISLTPSSGSFRPRPNSKTHNPSFRENTLNSDLAMNPASCGRLSEAMGCCCVAAAKRNEPTIVFRLMIIARLRAKCSRASW